MPPTDDLIEPICNRLVRKRIAANRVVIAGLRHVESLPGCGVSYQDVVDGLWDFWRQHLPDDVPPPPRPSGVADAASADDALDVLLRELNRAGDDKAACPESVTAAASLENRATALFLEHPEWNKKAIAAALNCHPKSLAPKRCPRLHAVIQAHRLAYDPLRGAKDAEGNLEAWEDDE